MDHIDHRDFIISIAEGHSQHPILTLLTIILIYSQRVFIIIKCAVFKKLYNNIKEKK